MTFPVDDLGDDRPTRVVLAGDGGVALSRPSAAPSTDETRPVGRTWQLLERRTC